MVVNNLNCSTALYGSLYSSCLHSLTFLVRSIMIPLVVYSYKMPNFTLSSGFRDFTTYHNRPISKCPARYMVFYRQQQLLISLFPALNTAELIGHLALVFFIDWNNPLKICILIHIPVIQEEQSVGRLNNICGMNYDHIRQIFQFHIYIFLLYFAYLWNCLEPQYVWWTVSDTKIIVI